MSVIGDRALEGDKALSRTSRKFDYVNSFSIGLLSSSDLNDELPGQLNQQKKLGARCLPA
jgi:hypothetical protein